jgi:hypothetical protein
MDQPERGSRSWYRRTSTYAFCLQHLLDEPMTFDESWPPHLIVVCFASQRDRHDRFRQFRPLDERSAELRDYDAVGEHDMVVERMQGVREEALADGEVAVGDCAVEDEVEDGSGKVREERLWTVNRFSAHCDRQRNVVELTLRASTTSLSARGAIACLVEGAGE